MEEVLKDGTPSPTAFTTAKKNKEKQRKTKKNKEEQRKTMKNKEKQRKTKKNKEEQQQQEEKTKKTKTTVSDQLVRASFLG